MKAIIKPQYVDQIPKAAKGTVRTLLDRKNETNRQVKVIHPYAEKNNNWLPLSLKRSLVLFHINEVIDTLPK